ATETTDPARLWAIANAAESQARNDRFDFGDYNEDVFVCEGVAEYAAERAEIVERQRLGDGEENGIRHRRRLGERSRRVASLVPGGVHPQQPGLFADTPGRTGSCRCWATATAPSRSRSHPELSSLSNRIRSAVKDQ